MTKSFSRITGMEDLYDPRQIKIWQEVEQTARRIFEEAGFQEVRTPLLESLGLFERSVGASTEIVEKEMYTLQDRGGKILALRPEGTASVVRAFIEHFTSHQILDGRFYYMGPMFRCERPQKGRLRQFHQIGAEIFGPDHPLVDAELIGLAQRFFSELGLSSLKLQLNSLGSLASREHYKEMLTEFLGKVSDKLCDDCQRRIQTNPLRALDCKKEACIAATREAPKILDALDQESKHQFEVLQEVLQEQKISYVINPRLVRGLDYYEKTVFEFTGENLGAQNAVAAGGRYNDLVQDLGGPRVPAIGFALGMERLCSLLTEQEIPQTRRARIYFIGLDELSQRLLFPKMQQMRSAEILTELDLGEGSLKSKMRRASRWEADWVVICGEKERQGGRVVLRNMQDSSQQEVLLSELSNPIKPLSSASS